MSLAVGNTNAAHDNNDLSDNLVLLMRVTGGRPHWRPRWACSPALNGVPNWGTHANWGWVVTKVVVLLVLVMSFPNCCPSAGPLPSGAACFTLPRRRLFYNEPNRGQLKEAPLIHDHPAALIHAVAFNSLMNYDDVYYHDNYDYYATRTRDLHKQELLGMKSRMQVWRAGHSKAVGRSVGRSVTHLICSRFVCHSSAENNRRVRYLLNWHFLVNLQVKRDLEGGGAVRERAREPARRCCVWCGRSTVAS